MVLPQEGKVQEAKQQKKMKDDINTMLQSASNYTDIKWYEKVWLDLLKQQKGNVRVRKFSVSTIAENQACIQQQRRKESAAAQKDTEQSVGWIKHWQQCQQEHHKSAEKVWGKYSIRNSGSGSATKKICQPKWINHLSCIVCSQRRAGSVPVTSLVQCFRSTFLEWCPQ